MVTYDLVEREGNDLIKVTTVMRPLTWWWTRAPWMPFWSRVLSTMLAEVHRFMKQRIICCVLSIAVRY